MSPKRPGEVKVAAVALACLVAIVAVLGTWQVLAARSSQRAEIEAGEANAAHLASSALSSSLESRIEPLASLVATAGAAQAFTGGTPTSESKVAAALHVLYPSFASFVLVGADGRLGGRWPSDRKVIGQDLRSQAFIANALRAGKPYVSEAEQQNAPPRELVVLLVVPVHSKAGRVVGLLIGSIPAVDLGGLIGGTRLHEGGSLVLFDQAGHALTGPSASAKKTFTGVTAIKNGLRGRTGTFTGQVPGYSGQRLVGYAPVSSTGWVVVAQQPASVLESPIRALTERLVAIGVVVVLLALGTALLVASLLRKLGREQHRAGALMSSVGEGVATLSSHGVITQANPALERLTGLPGELLVGKRWAEALNLYDQRGDLVPWQTSLAAEAVRQSKVLATSGYDLHLGQPDGRRAPVAMTAAPLQSGDEVLGSVVVLRDVSREREVDQLKSSLVSTVSHELRTPLTMIQGFSELLLAREDLGEVRAHEAVQQIHASSQRLARLIDDLLSVSRIDSGKLRVDLAPVDLAETMAEAVRVAKPQALASPGIDPIDRLVVEVPSEMPPVMGDRDKLVQVLVNLISNALKYSPAPGLVHIAVERKDDHAEISVADSGIGMSEEECAQAFEKFSRADRAEVRKVGGTGLGLYITKNLVEMQHGQVWVKSELVSRKVEAPRNLG